MPHAVELHRRVGFALQNHVNLRMLSVKVLASVFYNLGQMNGARKLIAVRKCPTGKAARASHRR